MQQEPSKLIFLPGAGGSPDFWKPVADLLLHPADRRLPGWPGFGNVPADPGIRGIDDLTAKVMDEMDEPCALIAQSMGGIIAVQAALRRPEAVTHLVLSVTSGGLDMASFDAEDWRPDFTRANPSFPRWFAEYREDLSASLPSITAPTLLLWGDGDPISPMAVGMKLKELIPSSRMHVFPGGGHDLANALAREVAPLIERHLKNAV